MLLLGTGPCSIVVRCKQSGQVIVRNTVLLLLSTLTCFGLHRCLDSGLGTRCVAASCCTRQGALIAWLLAATGSVPRLDAPIELRGMPEGGVRIDRDAHVAKAKGCGSIEPVAEPLLRYHLHQQQTNVLQKARRGEKRW